jgi:hypothetical protein
MADKSICQNKQHLLSIVIRFYPGYFLSRHINLTINNKGFSYGCDLHLPQKTSPRFSIAAPVQPVGVLCIRRTLSGGMNQGLASGLGAADAVYGRIAAFGLTAISGLLLEHTF